MMKNFIAVPETVQFYYGKKANYEAINLILDQENPPKDSTWEELNEFYGAQLAAQKTRYDLWCFFREIAAALWEMRLVALPHCREIDMADYEGEQRMEHVCSEEEFYQTYSIRDSYEFVIGCVIGEKDRLSVWFYVAGEKEDHPSSQWELGENWDPADENDVVYSKVEVPVPDCETIDLEPYHKVLDEIFQKLSTYC